MELICSWCPPRSTKNFTSCATFSTPSGSRKALSCTSIVSGPPLQTGPRSGSVKERITLSGPFTGTSSDGA